MEKYKILVKPSAVKEIEAISEKRVRQRLVRAIAQLAENPRPHNSQKLSGHDRHRLRCGPYRIVYAVIDRDRLVQVVKVGHRKDIYRGAL